MRFLWDIWRSKQWWGGMVAVALVQWLALAWGTPLYEIDTNSFIRGGLSWDIYHNPLLNIYIAACTHIWPNVWFIVGLQSLFYAAAAATLGMVLFREHPRLRWWAWSLAALEPLTMFYNHSFLAESFFTSFTLLTVATLILWLRHGHPGLALVLGLVMGLCFMAKLSAMIHLPLLALILLRRGFPLRLRVRGLAATLAPFIACYAFVYIGQRIINEGDIYTVEGRVRWDFASARYDSAEVASPDFARWVHPYIYREGRWVAHRELRRELSYLGYKDCVTDWEARGYPAHRGINACDSLFGSVARKILDQHFWQAQWQFIADNVQSVHTLSYVDYRFTPGLHYYHPQQEYAYIDSLMEATYGYSLAHREHQVPGLWRSLEFGNAYMTLLWWLWWAVLAVAIVLGLRQPHTWEGLVMAGIIAIPILFHLVYISYRPRFLAPYIVLMGMTLLLEVARIGPFIRRRP